MWGGLLIEPSPPSLAVDSPFLPYAFQTPPTKREPTQTNGFCPQLARAHRANQFPNLFHAPCALKYQWSNIQGSFCAGLHMTHKSDKLTKIKKRCASSRAHGAKTRKRRAYVQHHAKTKRRKTAQESLDKSLKKDLETPSPVTQISTPKILKTNNSMSISFLALLSPNENIIASNFSSPYLNNHNYECDTRSRKRPCNDQW